MLERQFWSSNSRFNFWIQNFFLDPAPKYLKTKENVENNSDGTQQGDSTDLSKNETFMEYFFDDMYNIPQKKQVLLRRMLMGLTSYYPGASEKIMPRFNRNTNIHIIEIPMSDYQFPIYESFSDFIY